MVALLRPFCRAAARRALSTMAESDPTGVEASLRRVASLITRSERLIVMCGAGVSESAGIPDFRCEGNELYDLLARFKLPKPESVFELLYFHRDVEPFYRLCREIWPGAYTPTPTHSFFTLLHQKQKLLRLYTLNIDSLETAAGLPADALVAANGSFDTASVADGGVAVPIEEVRRAAEEGLAAWGELNYKYDGMVKPDIVFTGESLPERFFRMIPHDFAQCDLLIIMGTSLSVQPFASLIAHVPSECSRVLINREQVGQSLHDPEDPEAALNFDSPRDHLCLIDCDDATHKLVQLLGWEEEFEAVRAKAIRGTQDM